ncbi:hypothetical protein [Haloarcula argentinensis]|uniref:Uncharacterized protein n=1 Tax=Haloarcula argentinensis TaxID=43776 RepID=A0ABU2F5K6_HALAR|nr:hypothetical protein [Haloarcula argentinensis]MDS0255804.1 hypothetical protein [Haloarcula argentinensis]
MSKTTRAIRTTGETGREALESLGINVNGRAALLQLSEATTTVRTSPRA